MNQSNRLQTALKRGLASPGDLSEELKALGDYDIATLADAKVLADALSEFAQRPPAGDDISNTLSELTGLFQSVSSVEAFRYLALHGIPPLISAYDARLSHVEECDGDLLFVLKMLARYGTEEGLDRVVAAAINPALCDGYLWAVVFEQLRDGDPIVPELVLRLSDPLPNGFACVAFLDWVNRLAREDVVANHPFDSADGTDRLQKWLLSSDEDDFSFAHSAAAALPFVSDPERSQLLAIAMDHPDVAVQMEAAWASSRLGSDAGVKLLARQCLDRNCSTTARAYLEELGRREDIPMEADDPDFRAMAEMCDWLAHPQEFGCPPDDIELYDSRDLYWPPTDDWRHVWLFKYHYQATDEDESDDIGLGMVGSITFALFDETNDTMSPEDAYAIHCCWELEANEDPRAPAERSIEAGRALLDAAPQKPPEDDEDF